MVRGSVEGSDILYKSTIHNESPCSIILQGRYIDIQDTDALDPNDLGIDDIPYIDQD